MAETSYDEVPYTGYVFHYTHPDRLATWGALLGLRPPPVDRCRVLELGCGTGSNLIPMAEGLPGSRFVGIDLSARQIAMGQAVVDDLRLANIELRALSIMDIGPALGRFDYIICHGVYSWVPAAVQDKALAICAENLSPEGIAYVSYNTYPGWHIRGMIREMMGYHVGRFPEPAVQVRQARALLQFLIQAVGDSTSAYARILKDEAEMLEDQHDSYLYHEHLEQENHPVYFHQFVERAAAKGLQYLAEARPSPLARNLSPESTRILEGVAGDLIAGEQYLDFVRNRTFRRTLLCHAGVAVRRPPDVEAVMAMHATTGLKPVGPELAGDATEEFVTHDDVKLNTNKPAVRTALRALFEVWPGSMPVARLLDVVRVRSPAAAADAPGVVADALLQCFLSNLMELHVHPPRLVTEVSDRPVAAPLARRQVAAAEPVVTSRRHRTVALIDLDRLVLRHLDGSRDRPALLDALAADLARGDLELQHEGQPIADRAQARAALADALGGSLTRLARSALLIQ